MSPGRWGRNRLRCSHSPTDGAYAMQDRFVLLITDRPDAERPLARSIERVLPCRVLEPGSALPAGKFVIGQPLAVVVSLASDETEESAWGWSLADRIRIEGWPCLYRARGASTGARRFGSPTIVPAGATRAALIAAVFDMIDRAAKVADTRCRWFALRAGEATRVVTGIFASAASGNAPSEAEADAGTEIVLEAVSEHGIRAWLDIVWKHDTQVYQHSLSVAGYAAAFGEELGLSRRDRQRLAKAALLHDVGKARIPLAILNKPGPLTADETQVMRTHPVIGADLLAAEGGFEAAVLDVVRHHHERLDGSGYPDGLAAGAVSDLVRLVTICDVYSGLTERRTYHAPLSGPQALSVMREMQGQLDLQLLRAYAPIIEQVSDVALVA